MAEPEIVDLSTLNAKQKGKEYKATQKDVKSKDLVVKGAAMKKLQDVRYYTEGGCLVPLINSSQPKKVILLDLFQRILPNTNIISCQIAENDGRDKDLP